jgi:hypothetical protein
MKKIEKQCIENGLTLVKGGKAKYAIVTEINNKSYEWLCKSAKECKEAIFQAVCLKKWEKAVPG